MPVVEKEMMSLGEPRQNLKPKLHKKGVKTTRIEVTSCKVKPLLFFRVKSTCTDGFCMVFCMRAVALKFKMIFAEGIHLSLYLYKYI